jgi:hypothetical protein
MSAVSKKVMPCSSARLMNGRLAASSSTQGRHVGVAVGHRAEAQARNLQAACQAGRIHGTNQTELGIRWESDRCVFCGFLR